MRRRQLRLLARSGTIFWGDVMKNYLRIALVGAIASTAAIATSSTANAWGCIAVSEEGSYGYSYNFDNQDDAVSRALNECAARTTTNSNCEITECDENS
jgi:hypothetical protein